jgi:hypothetical protein
MGEEGTASLEPEDSDPFDDDELIESALRAAVRDALIQHKRAGNSIVVQRDGVLVEIPADQIEIPDE